MNNGRLGIALAAVAAVAVGCGKVSPLDVKDGAAPADAGSDAGACQGLSESQCLAQPHCQPTSTCPTCNNPGVYSGCVPDTWVSGACPDVVCPDPCQGLGEAACRATAGCSVGTCSLCGNTPSFSGCYPTYGTPPPCPAVSCPQPCGGFSETVCAAHPECTAQRSCPTCNGTTTFVACVPAGTSFAPCPPISCPLSCSSITDLSTCDSRTDCHSVFVDNSTACDCATPGCCVTFTRCADGDRAQCQGTPLCKSLAPYCSGLYVLAYTATCYEGCVRATECAPVPAL